MKSVCLHLEGVRRRIGAWSALADVCLDVAAGESVAVLGPAGAGKSTLIRVLAGLDREDAGTLTCDGRKLGRVPAHRRGFGVVMAPDWLDGGDSVAQAVGLPLRLRRVARARRRALIDHALDLMQLQPVASARVRSLTPAERQRTVLARALVAEPGLLLLDDPLSAQPPPLRSAMAAALRRARAQLGATMLLATADPEEAFALGDRVALLHQGDMVQVDSPAALYARPRSARAFRLSGAHCTLSGRIAQAFDDEVTVTLEAGPAIPAMAAQPLPVGSLCVVCLRPEDVAVLAGPAMAMGEGALDGTLIDLLPLGDRVRLQVLLGSGVTVVSVRPMAALGGLRVGDPVSVGWQPERAVVFAA